MFDEKVRQLLEAKGPWNIRIDEVLGKMWFTNGTISVEFQPEVEEAIDSAPVIEWNVQCYKKLVA